MDIQAIIDGIVDAGEQQIASIRNSADAQVKTIRANAEAEADKQKRRILKDSKARLTRTQAVIEQRAYMQALQLHAAARQNLILSVLEKSKSDLQLLRKKPNYQAVLEKLISDSLAAIIPSLLDHQKIILHADQKDEAIIKSLQIPFKGRVQLAFDLHCSGGCEAESDDGLVRVLNTFESRFTRALPEIQQELSIFFEEKVSPS